MDSVFNAQIKETFLGIDDHNCLITNIQIEYCGFTQSIMHALGKHLQAYITGVIDVVGVDSWEKLRGKYIRIIVDTKKVEIKGIGHILNEDWFVFEDFFSIFDETKNTTTNEENTINFEIKKGR